jgi:hypothetical protein
MFVITNAQDRGAECNWKFPDTFLAFHGFVLCTDFRCKATHKALCSCLMAKVFSVLLVHNASLLHVSLLLCWFYAFFTNRVPPPPQVAYIFYLLICSIDCDEIRMEVVGRILRFARISPAWPPTLHEVKRQFYNWFRKCRPRSCSGIQLLFETFVDLTKYEVQ